MVRDTVSRNELDSLPLAGPGAVQVALSTLMAARRYQPAALADLADPFRREWMIESAAGQALKTSKETLRLLDILCWAREDPAILLSATELVADLGTQLVQLITLALYLQELDGVTLEQLGRSYEAACTRSEKPDDTKFEAEVTGLINKLGANPEHAPTRADARTEQDRNIADARTKQDRNIADARTKQSRSVADTDTTRPESGLSINR